MRLLNWLKNTAVNEMTQQLQLKKAINSNHSINCNKEGNVSLTADASPPFIWHQFSPYKAHLNLWWLIAHQLWLGSEGNAEKCNHRGKSTNSQCIKTGPVMQMPNANAALSDTVPGSKHNYSWKKKNPKAFNRMFSPHPAQKEEGKNINSHLPTFIRETLGPLFFPPKGRRPSYFSLQEKVSRVYLMMELE